MKSKQFILVAGAMTIVAIGVLLLAPRSQSYSTPEECMQTFYDAAKNANVPTYLTCLDSTLQDSIRKQYPADAELGEYLKSTTKSIMNWAQMGKTEVHERSATIRMVETRKNSSEEITYRLKRASGSWRIFAMDAPKKLRTILPYGIHEKEVWKNK